MSNKAGHIRDRLNEPLRDEELEPISNKFVEHLVDYNIDPLNQSINQAVVQSVINKMGVADFNWSDFTMTDEDFTKDAMDHLKSHLRSQKKDQCKALYQAIAKLKAERKADQDQKQDTNTDQEEDQLQIQSPRHTRSGKQSAARQMNAPPKSNQSAKVVDKPADSNTASRTKVKSQDKKLIYNEEEQSAADREVRIIRLIAKLKVNKREQKALMKEYESLMAARAKHVFNESDLSDR